MALGYDARYARWSSFKDSDSEGDEGGAGAAGGAGGGAVAAAEAAGGAPQQQGATPSVGLAPAYPGAWRASLDASDPLAGGEDDVSFLSATCVACRRPFEAGLFDVTPRGALRCPYADCGARIEIAGPALEAYWEAHIDRKKVYRGECPACGVENEVPVDLVELEGELTAGGAEAQVQAPEGAAGGGCVTQCGSCGEVMRLADEDAAALRAAKARLRARRRGKAEKLRAAERRAAERMWGGGEGAGSKAEDAGDGLAALSLGFGEAAKRKAEVSDKAGKAGNKAGKLSAAEAASAESAQIAADAALIARISDPRALRLAGNAAYGAGQDARAEALYAAALRAAEDGRVAWIKGTDSDAPSLRRIATVAAKLRKEVDAIAVDKAKYAAQRDAAHPNERKQIDKQQAEMERRWREAKDKQAAKGALLPGEVMDLTRSIDTNPVVAAAQRKLAAEHRRRFDERRRCALYSGVAAAVANRGAARARRGDHAGARADAAQAVAWDASGGKWRARQAAAEEELGELRAVQRTAEAARAAAWELSEDEGGSESSAGAQPRPSDALLPPALLRKAEAAARRLWGATRDRIDRSAAHFTAVVQDAQAQPPTGGADGDDAGVMDRSTRDKLASLRAFMSLPDFLAHDVSRPSNVVALQGIDKASMDEYEYMVRVIGAETPVELGRAYRGDAEVEAVPRHAWADRKGVASATGDLYAREVSTGEDLHRTREAIPGAGGQLALLHVGVDMEDNSVVYTAADLRAFEDRVRLPLCSHYAFGVPSAAAVEAIRVACPNGKLVEMGAGTGYWAAQLRRVGLDVLAYDRDLPDGSPFSVAPGSERGTKLHQVAHARVQRGGPHELAHVEDRTLLLCWPPADDPMAEECLRHYKGDCVVYVGEWEDGMVLDGHAYDTTAAHPGGPSCATPNFREKLVQEFQLVQRVEIPRWPTVADDLTVWARKTDAKGERLLTTSEDLEKHGRLDFYMPDTSSSSRRRR